MFKALRTMVKYSLIDDLYGNLVQTIAGGRKKTPDEVKAIIDQGPFISAQVEPKGLVDEVRFEIRLDQGNDDDNLVHVGDQDMFATA